MWDLWVLLAQINLGLINLTTSVPYNLLVRYGTNVVKGYFKMLAHRALAQTTYDSKEVEQLDVPACLYFSHHTHTVYICVYAYVCL